MKQDDFGSPVSLPISSPDYTLFDALRLLWGRRFLILFAGLGFGVLGYGIAILLPKKYEASVLLSIVSDKNGRGGLAASSSGLGQLSGLAAIAGISVSGSGGAKAEAVAILESTALTRQYVREKQLLPVLFESEWDSVKQDWRSANDKQHFTEWMGADYFGRKVRSVAENSKTGLVRLSIVWTDPSMAAQWANELVKLADDVLRQKAIEESRRNLAYLESAANSSKLLDVTKGIYSMMESEIQSQMLASGSEYFALKVLDPATPAERPSSMTAPLMAIAAGMAGLGFAALVVLTMGARGVRRLDKQSDGTPV